MAYEPKEWICGETITAEALNHIEDGLAECCESKGALGILGTLDASTEAKTLNKTWQEIYEAAHSGAVCSIYQTDDDAHEILIEPIVEVWSVSNQYVVISLFSSGVNVTLRRYSTTSADGYPVAEN